jgi:hypothetical protein
MTPSGSMASSQWNRAIGAGRIGAGQRGVGDGDGDGDDGDEISDSRAIRRLGEWVATANGRLWTSVWVDNSGPDTSAGLSVFSGPDIRENKTGI